MTLVDDSTPAGFSVNLANFEGPFDLLLHLVSRQKLDVSAIAIAEVADQYTADLPHPVACTTSTRAAGAMTAATASSWSDRGAAPSPASRCSTVWRWSCASAAVELGMGEGLAEPL